MPVPRQTTGEPDHAAHRRQEVLASTERLIALRGYDAVKLRDVAADAGVSIGLLQHYFTTRDTLVREAMRAGSHRRILEWTQAAQVGTTEWQRLRILLVASVSDPARCAIWLELCAASTHHPELREDIDAVQREWRDLISRTIDAGRASGEFSPVVPLRDLTDILINIIDGKMLDIATTSDRDVSTWVATTTVLTRRLLGLDGAGQPARESSICAPIPSGEL